MVRLFWFAPAFVPLKVAPVWDEESGGVGGGRESRLAHWLRGWWWWWWEVDTTWHKLQPSSRRGGKPRRSEDKSKLAKQKGRRLVGIR